ncbi:MAG: DUF5106 domain-containing protein [Clostridium sp.]|nr:DUF5106 domain-containing protein [Bacteroides sp.]MCM1198023.1 DUF5106 domain-containing protein [Clostridium sp.]
MKRILYMALVLSVAAGCGQGKVEKFSPLPFPVVNVPGVYADDREAAVEYALMHYWDALADTSRSYPCDSSLVSGVRRDDVEHAYANFLGMMGMADIAVARDAVVRMYGKAVACEAKDTSSNVFETLTALTERYLYDPNSPLRMEDLYGVYAGLLAGYEGFSPEKRAVYAYDAQMCALNAVGTPAADFQFSDASGKMHSLYGIKAEYTLLFFSNPGCAACKDIINVLTEDPVVSAMVATGRLAVANIYIDEDISAWYEYMPVYPSSWYNGYDPNGIIREDTLYNVRAIPSLYLLDSHKTVLMKDAAPENVFGFLGRL